MANRSYVYSCNKMPGNKDSIDSTRAKAITEVDYGYDVGTICLIGAKPLGIKSSLIWPKATSLVSDFNEGFQLFKIVFENLVKHKFVHKQDYATSISYLTKRKGKFIIGEFTELSGMNVDDEMPQDFYFRKVNMINKEYLKDIVKHAKALKEMIDPGSQKYSNKGLQKYVNVLLSRDRVKDFQNYIKRLEKDNIFVDFYCSEINYYG